MRKVLMIVSIGLLPAITYELTSIEPAWAVKGGVCEREITSAAKHHNVPPAILYAVGLTETSRGGQLQPHALNIEGRAVFPASRTAAVRTIERALKSGQRLIDVGCMQINHHYHAKAFRGLNDMLNPARNVDYAARFLQRLKRRHGSWSMAVARYHAGGANNAAQKKYVCRVLYHMISQGMARHTASSRKICKTRR